MKTSRLFSAKPFTLYMTARSAGGFRGAAAKKRDGGRRLFQLVEKPSFYARVLSAVSFVHAQKSMVPLSTFRS